MTTPSQPIQLAVDAGRAGDVIALHALLDWPLSGAAIIADLGEVSPRSRVSVLTSGLASLDAAAAGDLEIIGKVVLPLANRLATATDVQPAAPDVRDRFLARVRLPEEFVEGPTSEQLERLAALRSRAAEIRDVFVISLADGSLTVAVTPEGRLVVSPED
jgi:hypothetical protein